MHRSGRLHVRLVGLLSESDSIKSVGNGEPFSSLTAGEVIANFSNIWEGSDISPNLRGGECK